MTDREALAFHEAGHAVIAETLHLPTRAVSIISGASGAGRSLLSVGIGKLPVWQVASWVLAGPESEKFFAKVSRARLGSDDYTFVRSLLENTRQPDEDVDALGRRYEALAAGLVIVHERWIAVVAKQLLREKALTAQVVRDLQEAI